jgi:hypothetical protein
MDETRQFRYWFTVKARIRNGRGVEDKNQSADIADGLEARPGTGLSGSFLSICNPEAKVME